MLMNLSFNTIGELRRWLENKNFDAESPEAFCDWLHKYFDEGNTITVHGEEYDYWACWELV